MLAARLYAGVTALALVAVWFAAPVGAQTPKQLDWCNGKNRATPDLRIKGCTAVIQSGKFAGQNLAIAFVKRGHANYDKGQFDRAIQDFDQAIRLNPNYAAAFNDRSRAKDKKGDKAGAEADLAAARRIDPNAGRWATPT